MNNTTFVANAQYMKAAISPKKVAPVMDLVRGKGVKDAKLILTFDTTKAADMILKMLKSAEANAVVKKYDPANLYISEIWVGPGRMVRTGRAGSRGHFDPIIKRSSHMYVYLSERVLK